MAELLHNLADGIDSLRNSIMVIGNDLVDVLYDFVHLFILTRKVRLGSLKALYVLFDGLQVDFSLLDIEDRVP